MEDDLKTSMQDIGKKARQAALELAVSSGENRSRAITLMKEKLASIKDVLFKANREDLKEAEADGLEGPMLKRLTINEKVFNYVLSRLTALATLDDPLGRVLEGFTRPDGLHVERISVPIGVIAVIYESRPNVTPDAASVCIKSGNAVILRGGSESLRTNIVLADALREAVTEAGLPANAVQMVRTNDREAVTHLLKMDQFIDVIIPRGGKGLIRKIAGGTNIPVIKHYEGICHLYLAEDAPMDWALDLSVNSKCQSIEVCNALETLLVDAGAADRLLPELSKRFRDKGVELRGCAETLKILMDAVPATEEDWRTEYLAPILSVKVVNGLAEAVRHINTYGSGHTDGIVTKSLDKARRFVEGVDSASVMVNASTRLSGGGDYGLGAVVGISTDKIHARGPVGPMNLTSYKWVAYGQGHLRE
ncbi:MAG: glutamate-5-semialdehyde dehydrogenase [Spirochaetales bacterium]|nr:glutamate-5-semialdehyde dehydrogenase [Spirochaetales bacterium]